MQKGNRDSSTMTEDHRAPAGTSASGDGLRSSASDRRGFLKRGVLATAGVAATLTSPVSFSRAFVEQSSAAKKILVIGAGLAGLSAAYELVQANGALQSGYRAALEINQSSSISYFQGGAF